MKFNWGTKIAILYLGFVALILTLVFKSMAQKVDLVSDDYYEQEIKFQDQLNGLKNTGELKGNFMISAKEQSVKIEIPEGLRDQQLIGKVKFYRPSDNALDVEFPLSVSKEGEQVINSSKFKRGSYKIQFKFKANNKDYYYEESLFMN